MSICKPDDPRFLHELSCCLRCACLLLVLVIPFCMSLAQSKDQTVSSLIERAKQLSDIRAEGAGAFTLRAKFTATRNDGTTVEAAYTETWTSPRMWRSELTSADLHQTEVIKDKTRWLLSNFPNAPEMDFANASTLENLIAFRLDDNSVSLSSWKAAKIEDRASGSWSLRCAESVNERSSRKSEMCFDTTNGALVARSTPVHQASTGSDFDNSCVYTNYQKFGGKTFPRSIQCVAGGTQTLQGTVVDIKAAETPPDQSLFVPLPGARELTYCTQETIPPEIFHQVDPTFPIDSRNPTRHIAIVFTVGTDGQPRELRVIRSAGRASDDVAMEAARKWRFRPATCGGEPIESEQTLEVFSRRY